MNEAVRIKAGVDRQLDITADKCPMTYVRVRLALDRMKPDQVLLVTLKGDEPLRNVPRTAVEQGHQVLGIEPNEGEISLVWIRKQ